MTYLRINTRE